LALVGAGWRWLARLARWRAVLLNAGRFSSIFFMMQIQVVYRGENRAQEIPSMRAPRIVDFHDPSHCDMEVEIFKDHIDSLRSFELPAELAAQLIEGRIYDAELKTVLIITK